MRQAASLLALLALALSLAGCAGQKAILTDELPDSATPVVELRQTPFFPQIEYQCGPAALATVLVASGVNVTPGQLVGQVYLPERKGSLQAEILASARRHGRLPYLIDPELSALIAELNGGRPVLVLLNLALDLLPAWHYAVVIGYDAGTDTVLLRSGTTERRTMSASRFLSSWRKANSWAVVVLEPGEMPAGADSQRYVHAAAGLERAGQPQAARDAYTAALKRWPDYPEILFGLGNAEYALRRFEAAERAYLLLLRKHPGYVPGWNNLATLLSERGCTAPALRSVEQALRRAPGNSPFRETLETTRREILERQRSGATSGTDCLRSLPGEALKEQEPGVSMRNLPGIRSRVPETFQVTVSRDAAVRRPGTFSRGQARSP